MRFEMAGHVTMHVCRESPNLPTGICGTKTARSPGATRITNIAVNLRELVSLR